MLAGRHDEQPQEALQHEQEAQKASSSGAVSVSASANDNNVALIIPPGHRLRDEFICPITRELIVDPVIAADGHTYDRAAIEQWYHRQSQVSNNNNDSGGGEGNNDNVHVTSPKTGEVLDHLHLIPNHNLSRLVRDMVREGGSGLCCPEHEGTIIGGQNDHAESSVNNRVALVRTRRLQCRCLGPPESDWIGRTFRFMEPTLGNVNGNSQSIATLRGGRRRPTDAERTDGSSSSSDPIFVQFSDATVSRAHFEICFVRNLAEDDGNDEEGMMKTTNIIDFDGYVCDRTDVKAFLAEGRFLLRDLGSAGGTFVRVPPGRGISLRRGMMIMLGKHQLEVQSITTQDEGQSISLSRSFQENGRRSPSGNRQEVMHRLESTNTEAGNDAFLSIDANTPRYGEVERGFGSDTCAATSRPSIPRSAAAIAEANNGSASPILDAELQMYLDRGLTDHSDTFEISVEEDKPPNFQNVDESDEAARQIETDADVNPSSLLPNTETVTTGSAIPNTEERIVLRCFAPQGSPVQNKEYIITSRGLTLGRKRSNDISFSQPVHTTALNNSTSIGDTVMQYIGIDSSISGEHARIVYDSTSGEMRLYDGAGSHGSTNGTWLRLSVMQQVSDWFVLEDKMEFLVGGHLRFMMSIDEILKERDYFVGG